MNSAELQNRVLGAWVQKRRMFLRLTQSELATKTDCTTDLISKIERGNRHISKQLAPKLSDAFGLSVDEQTHFMRLVAATRSPGRMERLPRMPHSAYAVMNVPEPGALLIGRDAALAHCTDLLVRRGVRLLTFTGPPGVGKTHLATELARHLAHQYADGARFVSLIALPPGGDVLQTLIDAHFMRMPAGQACATDLLTLLIQALADQQLLLLLDNFEHVRTRPNMQIINKLLASCPKLKVIVTSRAVLSLPAEHVFAVQPLALPSNDAGQSPDELMQNPAVAIFAARAQAVNSGFAVSHDNFEAVRDLAIFSQGIPMVLELLAARMRMLSVRELLAQLTAYENPAQALLTFTVHHDDLEHQRTLATTIGWSMDLLQPDERRMLAQLAQIHGSFGLEPISAVCAGALRIFESLISQSLVQRVEPAAADPQGHGNPDPGASRYFLLKCVRLVVLQDLPATVIPSARMPFG